MAWQDAGRAMIAKVEVLRSWKETPTVHAVRFTRPKGFTFRPVQFCGLEFMTDEGSVEYPMSLASSPTRDYLEFGARVASRSPWKRAFEALQPGDEAEVDGPYGHFVLDEHRPAVFIAGGIGVTPLKGMAAYMADKQVPQDAVLVYSNKTPDEVAYKAELDELAARNPRFRVVHTVTQAAGGDWPGHRGRIGEALLREASAGLREPVYYVCGGPGMVEAMVGLLQKDLGVPGARIRFEQFWGYA
jgi:ferredoxin-NADP reductase